MRKIVKRFLNRFGLDIKRISKMTSSAECCGSYFMEAGRFVIEFERVELRGNTYFVPKYSIHRPAVKSLIVGRLYEPETHRFVSEFCSSFNGSMVHAGTFFGDMLPSFSRSVSGYVYAFEPVLENYVLAKLCVEFNELKNVILMNCALSDGMHNVYIDTYESDGRHAGGGSRVSDKGVISASVSIDQLCIEDLVLIQLDVEGHELKALRGAETTIQKLRPVVAIEDNRGNCSGFLSKMKYQRVAQIPGLSIWSPVENNWYKEKVLSILG